MKHIAAYLLLQLGGNPRPTAADVKGVLGSVGIEADEERLDKLIAELEGKEIDQLIREGNEKLAFAPSTGNEQTVTNNNTGTKETADVDDDTKSISSFLSEDSDIGLGLFDD